MTDVIKTSSVSIPSVALARMVWTLADCRAFPNMEPSLPVSQLKDRSISDERYEHGYVYPASSLYYRIIDAISAGEAP